VRSPGQKPLHSSFTTHRLRYRESLLPGHPRTRILVQFANGDRSAVNPVTMAVIRAGRLADRTTLDRADLARTTDPRGIPKNLHNYIFDEVDGVERPFALPAQIYDRCDPEA